MKTTKQINKIDWKRLIIKSLENGVKKAVEIVFLALVLGSTMKMFLLAVPAAMIGTAFVKVIKVGFLQK